MAAAFVVLPIIVAEAGAVATEAAVVTTGTTLLAAHGYKLFCSLKGLFAAKGSAGAVGAAAKAYTATTAATTATTMTATATAATTAGATTTATTATGAAAASTTTTTAAWLGSMAMTPMGVVVIGCAAGCAAYYAYRAYRSWMGPGKKPSEATPKRQDKEKTSRPTPEHEPPPGLGKPVLIPKKELEELLESEGREMYEKLKKVLKSENPRNVWFNRDYRIDPGPAVRDNPNLKTWNFQVQRDAVSGVARRLKDLFGTHKKLFRDVFNVAKPPAYDAWVKRVLSVF
ncbi:hypothetical protein BJY04DRAFT_196361 [Aspergillus karnatakaensis]|uniref:uncharacterized protein n=1 Tax=Aspergillus karnatakaensis TaxID=1810916 RepID=UPI003CCDEE82